MTASRSAIEAARVSPERAYRTEKMAEALRDLHGAFGNATFAQLCADGFTDAEIFAYIDDARALAGGRPLPGTPLPPGRAEGEFLASQARAARARAPEQPTASAPAPEPATAEDPLAPFGVLAPALRAGMQAAGLAVLPEAELHNLRMREMELNDALEHSMPAVDCMVRALRFSPGWSAFRGRLAELVEAA